MSLFSVHNIAVFARVFKRSKETEVSSLDMALHGCLFEARRRLKHLFTGGGFQICQRSLNVHLHLLSHQVY